MLEINPKNIRFLSMLGQRGACGQALADAAENDENILCLTADLCTTSGLDRFREKYPGRLLNAGIAEQNMLGMAAGLAMDGYQVYASTFATFASMRAVEQMRTLLAYMDLNVKVIGMAAGFSMGFFGNTHYSMEDIAIARVIPNLNVYSPADALETYKMLLLLSKTKEPCYLRLTGAGNHPCVYTTNYEFELGTAVVLSVGSDAALVATGSMVYQAIRAAKELEAQGISCTVINMHTIKPLDTEAIDRASDGHRLIVTIEEHGVLGGLGGAVAEYLAGLERHAPLEIIGVPNRFTHAGDYGYMLESSGLTAPQIAERVLLRLSGETRR